MILEDPCAGTTHLKTFWIARAASLVTPKNQGIKD